MWLHNTSISEKISKIRHHEIKSNRMKQGSTRLRTMRSGVRISLGAIKVPPTLWEESFAFMGHGKSLRCSGVARIPDSYPAAKIGCPAPDNWPKCRS